jgi:mRNA interferase HigB
MRIITWGRVQAFIDRHADSERPLRAWRTQIQSKDHPDPNSLLGAFPYASIIDDQRVVFNVKGNDYRLVAAIHYDRQRLFVRGVFTHAEYDRIDARTL